jgi:hypothetical protein
MLKRANLREMVSAGIGIALLCMTWAERGSGQTSATTATVPSGAYISARAISTQARWVLGALGQRLQQPGSERVIYQGIYTDSIGATPAKLVWQLPGYLLLTLTNRGKTYYVDPVAGVQNSSALSAAEVNMLESFGNDSPEAFLYSVAGQGAVRFAGGRFRIDNGKTPNYSGPWYDVFQSVTPVLIQGKTVRRKFYYFDGQSKLFLKSQYMLQGSAGALVSTEYANWTATQGYATPGQIVRKENGNVVFTLTVQSAAIGPQQNDGTFPGH